MESEMREMCNLSVGVMEQGMKRGIAQGMEQGIERGEARFAELTKKLMEQNQAKLCFGKANGEKGVAKAAPFRMMSRT